MRRILGDNILDGSKIITKPAAEGIIPGTPEPSSYNLGKTGVIAMGEKIHSAQDITVTIAKSGGLTNGPKYVRQSDAHGSFVFKVDDVVDDAGNSVVDSALTMGKNLLNLSMYHQVLENTDVSGDNDIFDVCCCKLTRHNSYDADYGIVGLCAYIGYDADGITARVHGFRLRSCQAPSSAADPRAYEWVAETSFEDDIDTQVSPSYDPCLDMIEMDDGSVILVVDWGDTLEMYVSYDAGDSWTHVNSTDASLVGSHRIAIDRIGSMAVIIHGRIFGSDVELYSLRSVDGGMTWFGFDPSSSAPYKIFDGTPASPPTTFDIDMVRNSRDNRLEVMFIYHNDLPYQVSTYDGVNFIEAADEAMFVSTFSGVACVEYYNTFVGLFIDSTDDEIEIHRYIYNRYSIRDTAKEFGYIMPGTHKATLTPQSVAAESFENDGFVEVVSLHKSTAGSGEWMVVASRCAQWDSVSLFPSTRYQEWDHCYVPIAFPSSSDSEPNFANWTQIVSGAGSSGLSQNGAFPYTELKLTTVAGSDTIGYKRTFAVHASPPADSYEDGFIYAFEAALDDATSYFQVYTHLSDSGENKETKIIVTWTGTGIEIYDNVATSLVTTLTPTNWDPTDFNFYKVAIHRTSVKVYRAPSGHVRDIVTCEYVGGATVTTQAYTADGIEIEWGLLNGAGKGAAADAYVRSFSYMESVSYDETDMSTPDYEGYGMGCRPWPCGLTQGLSCKFTGSHVYQTDEWTLETDEVYSSKNIFTPSPSVCWKEPEQTSGDSPQYVIDVARGNDSDGQPLNMPLNGFALFGRNFMNFKLESMNADGTSLSELFNTSGSYHSYICEWEVDGVDDNMIGVWPSSPAAGQTTFTPMIPGQFAPSGSRKYYIKMKDGACANDVFMITGNEEDRLYLCTDLAAEGVLDNDNFYLFSSSFFYYKPTYKYAEAFRLTIYSQARPKEDSHLQLGTLVIGQLFDLPDDEWGAQYAIKSNNAVNVGRSGRRIITEIGPPARTISITYSGILDKGMGISEPNELFRLLRGKHPLVWIDDDSQQDGSGKGHSEPILCRHNGEISQKQVAYNYYDESDSEGFGYGQSFHNVLDTSSIVLEEEV